MGTLSKTTLTGSIFVAVAMVPPIASPEQPGPTLPDTLFHYTPVDLPAHFNTPRVAALDNTPADNAITNAGATLGRVLFYDIQLSANNTVACASCHVQAAGFSDPRTLSVGFEGGHTRRNSMGLTNARYYRNGRFFWDERAETLEQQVLMPIQDPVEMGMTLEVLEQKLQELNYYPQLFRDAFRTSTVTSDRIAKALAQFVRSLVSYQSRYDEGLANANSVLDDFPSVTAEENIGKRVFLRGSGRVSCSGCHMNDGRGRGRGGRGQEGRNTAVFQVQGARNIGLDADRGGDDGRGEVTGRDRDDGEFKAPSLRNVELTGPYMHDGRFATLEDVVTHYSSGIQSHPNLDFRLRRRDRGGQGRRGAQQVQARGLNLSELQQRGLVAFLKTLTDDTLVHDIRFSDPFR